MPDNLIASLAVQDETERALVFPHETRNIVSMPELIRKSIAVCIKEKTANAAKRFSGEPLLFYGTMTTETGVSTMSNIKMPTLTLASGSEGSVCDK
jgi:hypothetical protein